MSAGRALLLLLPSERQAMLDQLEAAKIPLTQIKPNPAKQQAVSPALQVRASRACLCVRACASACAR